MATKTLNTRLKLKTKKTAEWALETTFVPLKGEVVVYSDHQTKTEGGQTIDIPGFKVGDGNAYVVDLPFVSEKTASDLISHASDTTIHTTAAEKTIWNNKVSVQVSGENIIFS